MRVPFRQGIVYTPANFLTLSADQVSIILPQNETVLINFADGTSNYLVTETQTVTNAWSGPFTIGTNYWLYWDINVQTGAKTYGYTTIEPSDGPTAPTNPLNKQCWFNTSTSIMFEYNNLAAKWQRKVRVFASALISGGLFVSMSINSPSYIGTQVGDLSNVSAGSLVFDNDGYALKKGNGTFFTTEDVAVTGVGTNSRIKLESISLSAIATANLAAYTMVRFVDFSRIASADNLLSTSGVYGMIEVDAVPGDVVNVIRDGLISNVAWNFPVLNAPIYVDATGQITTVQHSPKAIGLVVNPATILLTSTTVENVTLIESAVTIFGPTSGVVVTGNSGPLSSIFNVTLTADLNAVENIAGTGVVQRISDSVWVAGALNLSTGVSNQLSTSNGGTGNSLMNGYIKGDGIAGNVFTAALTIPGGDVAGNITGFASNVTGTVGIINGGTGATNQSDAINTLLPIQSGITTNKALFSNGDIVEWRGVSQGTLTSLGVTTDAIGMVVSNTPITTAGNIHIAMGGNLKSVDNLSDFGIVSRDFAGNFLGHSITSPTNTINLFNNIGALSGDITLDLPVIKLPETLASVNTDVYGRVTSGSATLPWSSISSTPTTLAGYGIANTYTQTQVNNLTWNWSVVTSTPTTISGYGIADAYTKTEVNNLTWNWSHISTTPTSLLGYGITDAVVNAGGANSVAINSTINRPAPGVSGRIYIDTTLNDLSYDNGSVWTSVGNTGTVSSVNVTSTSPGLTISGGPITSTGAISVELAGDLASLENMATGGFAVRLNDVSSNWATRTVLGTIGNISVTNGDGLANDPQIDLVNVGTPGTFHTVTVDSKGRVTNGIVGADWSTITGTPTTVTGYGITNAVTTDKLAAPLGVATLDAVGKLLTSQLPALAITDTFVVNSEAEMLALVAQTGDVAIRPDITSSFILTTNNPNFLTSWQALEAPDAGGGVTYVNIASLSPGITVSGTPITTAGTIDLSLAGNLASIDAITTSGIIHKTGAVWSAGGTVDLTSDVSGILPVPNGGTGVSVLTGHVSGNGIGVMTASLTIPGADIAGNILGNAANITGIIGLTNGGTGQITANASLNALLPVQTLAVGQALMSDGTNAIWAVNLDEKVTTSQVALGGFAPPLFITMGVSAAANQTLNTDTNLTYDANNFILNTFTLSATSNITTPMADMGFVRIQNQTISNTNPGYTAGADEILTINPSQTEVVGILNIIGSTQITPKYGAGGTDGGLTVGGNLVINGPSTTLNSVNFTTASPVMAIVTADGAMSDMGISVATAPTGGVLSSLVYSQYLSRWNTTSNLAINNGIGNVYGGIIGLAGNTSTVSNLALVNTPDLLTVPTFDIPTSAISVDVGVGSSSVIHLVDGTNIAAMNITNSAGWLTNVMYTLRLVVVQPATHALSPTGVTVVWPVSFKWAGATPPVLSSANNSIDIVEMITYNSGATWLCTGTSLNL